MSVGVRNELGRFIGGAPLMVNCGNCKKQYEIPLWVINAGRGKFCSRNCRYKFFTGENNIAKRKEVRLVLGKQKIGQLNPKWKGGIQHTHGYIKIKKPEHPNADHHDYVFEHRLVVEASIGRYLTMEEVVHHINQIKDDNRIENLELLANDKEHLLRHPEKMEKARLFNVPPPNRKGINLTELHKKHIAEGHKCKKELKDMV